MREASKRLPGDVGTPGVGNGRPDQTRDHSLESVKDCLAGIQISKMLLGGYVQSLGVSEAVLQG